MDFTGSDLMANASQLQFSSKAALQYLSFSYNQLSGELQHDVLDGQPALISVEFESNSLWGALPDLAGAISLQYLDFSAQRDTTDQANGLPVEAGRAGLPGLSGGTPSSWKDLNALQTLDLSANRLDGALPLSQLLSIATIDVSFNLLTGKTADDATNTDFATWITDVASVYATVSLTCSYNQFTGPWSPTNPADPTVNGKSPFVTLIASHNQLTQVYGGLLCCTLITTFDFSYNAVTSLAQTDHFISDIGPLWKLLDLRGNPNFTLALPKWVLFKATSSAAAGALYSCADVYAVRNPGADFFVDPQLFSYTRCTCITGLYAAPILPNCLPIPDSVPTLPALREAATPLPVSLRCCCTTIPMPSAYRRQTSRYGSLKSTTPLLQTLRCSPTIPTARSEVSPA